MLLIMLYIIWGHQYIESMEISVGDHLVTLVCRVIMSYIDGVHRCVCVCVHGEGVCVCVYGGCMCGGVCGGV